METPSSDEMAGGPRREVASGCSLLFFAIFLLLVAVAGYIAWNRNPPDAPTTRGTAAPPTLPPAQ
jgi:hypothetical protein